ncbi:unnamed protein product [Leptosia nina]|uniref:Uncharacterized protein n=1 Tax=Leptosia nina TaxID=320188 RepID=A0AAV1JRM4_9NEOP
MVRLSKRIILLACFLLVTSRVGASVINDGLEEHLKDVAHNEAAEVIKLEKQKGDKDHHIESIINDNHSNEHSKTTDDLKYVKKDHETKAASENDEYGGSNVKQDKQEDSHTDGYKRGHKKGHHKQGFQNSYHKDESSNKSTYFDDFNDEGDQAAYKSKLNSYDNRDGRNYKGSHNNGHEYLRDHYRGGGHNRYGDVGNKRRAYQDHGKNHYLNDLENYNKYRNGHNTYDRGNVYNRHEYKPHVPHHDPSWDWQQWNDRRAQPGWEERPDWDRRSWGTDYSGPGYYDHGIRHDSYGPNTGYGYRYGESQNKPVAEIPVNIPQEPSAEVPANAPIVARRKQTITIYEDPRYSGKDGGQLRREEGDYIQLDIKPSTRQYSSYDDTYYNLPVRDAEASSINRLVYNYRRT